MGRRAEVALVSVTDAPLSFSRMTKDIAESEPLMTRLLKQLKRISLSNHNPYARQGGMLALAMAAIELRAKSQVIL